MHIYISNHNRKNTVKLNKYIIVLKDTYSVYNVFIVHTVIEALILYLFRIVRNYSHKRTVANSQL